jgi:hypothetical protein
MLIPSHDTACHIERQRGSHGDDSGTTAVLPRLPTNLAAPARVLNAFPRVRGLATPHDLRRGRLA